MCSGEKGFLTTDSLIGIVIVTVMVQLCHLCVGISVRSDELIRQKITESEQNYEYSVSAIGDCIVCEITEEEVSSSNSS